MFSFNTTKATSSKFKSTRTCLFCGGTGFRHNGYKVCECNVCKDGGMGVELDVDRLIEFLQGEISQYQEMLKDEELELDHDLRKYFNGKAEHYEYLLSIIFSNSLR